MTDHMIDHDEHLPVDVLSKALEIDPFATLPLPQPRTPDDTQAPTTLDTIVAVLMCLPDKRHFASLDAGLLLMRTKGIERQALDLFADTHKCSTTQALKCLLVHRAWFQRGVHPVELYECIVPLVLLIEEYASDRDLWQALVTLRIDPSDTRVAGYRYKLMDLEMPTLATIVQAAARFEGLTLPTDIGLARIARPHDFPDLTTPDHNQGRARS